MTKVKMLAILSLLLLSVAYSWAAEVKNIVAGQVKNRAAFTYDLIGEEADAEVTVTITVGGKTYQASDLHLEGDFGKVATGHGKTIYWNVLQDFPKGFSGTIAWEIVAGGKEYVRRVTSAKSIPIPAGGKQFVSRVLGATFVLIPAGTFMMGESNDAHQVTFSKPFYMQTTELTQGQWKRVVGSNPSHFKNCGDDCPVELVSWNDCRTFISKLNSMEGTDKYRLPTEAEWEYAAKSGGKQEEYAGTSSSSDLDKYAWYDKNSGSKTHPVGQKKPNSLGLYDISGNVWEWVQDWKGDYPSGHVTNPTGPSSGSSRVDRGGSWDNSAKYCRSANRYGYTPDFRGFFLGFRLVRQAGGSDK